ncbi:MAG: cytochrome c [Candidatus Viridilinea halotolerans]|uniref:Cytochrome c n=1 Tax=Candidatus Viridilinea halotolerans TaxID=2491704 RepID=A0A426U6M0_9CHLR|nr:MAG: cytochrome c [Candidatus Viridilinea halotolerans]
MKPKLSIIWLVLITLSACGASTAAPPPDPVASGERLYNIWCLGCHSLDPDGPTTLGPPLGGVATRAAANSEGLSAAAWLRRETLDPNANVTPGYTSGMMPSDYERAFSPEQLEALIAFMLTLE